MGIVILLLITALATTAWHYYLPQYFVASVGAAITSVVLLQLGAYFHLGHLDPFFPIAIAVSFAVAFAFALLIGLPLQPVINKIRRTL